MSRRKSSSRVKLKTVNQEKRMQKWKEHFENMFENSHKPTQTINRKLDIKLGPFMEELDANLIKQKSCRLRRNTFRSIEDMDIFYILLRLSDAVYKQNIMEKWTKGCILRFLKEGDLEINKNYRNITLTAITFQVYNGLLLKLLEPETEKILRKNQNVFKKNRFTNSEILIIHWIIEGTKKSRASKTKTIKSTAGEARTNSMKFFL